VACIFCEVCLKEPLFPGNDYLHQLKIIMQQIGKPGEADQWFVQNANAKAFLESLPNTKARPLAERVPNAPRGLVDLAERMLVFNPRERLPIARSVEHRAFDDYREDDLELRAGYRVEMDDVENVTLDKAAIRALLWKDIRAFQRNSEPVGDRAVSPDEDEDLSRQSSDLERLSNCGGPCGACLGARRGGQMHPPSPKYTARRLHHDHAAGHEHLPVRPDHLASP